ELRAGALVIGTDAFFTSRGEQLAALSIRYGLPAVYQSRDFALAGGLVSYGALVTESFRLVGVYTVRILKGEKHAERPEQRITKVEMILNLKTAKALSLTVPPTLLARADEVSE